MCDKHKYTPTKQVTLQGEVAINEMDVLNFIDSTENPLELIAIIKRSCGRLTVEDIDAVQGMCKEPGLTFLNALRELRVCAEKLCPQETEV